MDAHETSIFTAVLITCIVLAVVITYFIISIVRHQRRNQKLYKSKILAEITTLEKERKRIASDLHDELGPILSSVKMRINCMDITSEEDQVQLSGINKHIDEMIQRMREISNDLMPNTLLRKGLVAAVQEFIDNTSKPNSFTIIFNHQNIEQLPQDKAIHIYRILQEIIHNTIKHSVASRLVMELSRKNNYLILLTEDDGLGFDYTTKTKENSGLGIRNLLSRTEILGGQMYLDSRLGKGAKYTFEIPL